MTISIASQLRWDHEPFHTTSSAISHVKHVYRTPFRVLANKALRLKSDQAQNTAENKSKACKINVCIVHPTQPHPAKNDHFMPNIHAQATNHLVESIQACSLQNGVPTHNHQLSHATSGTSTDQLIQQVSTELMFRCGFTVSPLWAAAQQRLLT